MMKNSQPVAKRFLAVGILVAALSPQAFAGSSGTAQMGVTLKVAQSCTLSVGSVGLDFSTQTADGSVQQVTPGALSVKCRASTAPITVTLSKQAGAMAGTGDNQKTVPYTLYGPSSHTWGSTNTCQYTTQWSGTGEQFTVTNAGNQTIAVCGTATIASDTPVDTYSDTVQVEVTWN
jgi:spore coat protein U-like protein